MRLLLASASPRRADLLRAAGFDFDVLPANVDETVRPDEEADTYACRVARAKAAAVRPLAGDRLVLAADTVVVVARLILGKPTDPDDAARMLGLLSGHRHEVLTAVTMVAPGRDELTRVETTSVEFSVLTPDEVAWYVASGEPADKAGAYAVQGLASRFVTRIDGSYSNVVGLPIALVYTMLLELRQAGAEAARGFLP
jgi:septum formation protein